MTNWPLDENLVQIRTKELDSEIEELKERILQKEIELNKLSKEKERIEELKFEKKIDHSIHKFDLTDEVLEKMFWTWILNHIKYKMPESNNFFGNRNEKNDFFEFLLEENSKEELKVEDIDINIIISKIIKWSLIKGHERISKLNRNNDFSNNNESIKEIALKVCSLR